MSKMCHVAAEWSIVLSRWWSCGIYHWISCVKCKFYWLSVVLSGAFVAHSLGRYKWRPHLCLWVHPRLSYQCRSVATAEMCSWSVITYTVDVLSCEKANICSNVCIVHSLILLTCRPVFLANLCGMQWATLTFDLAYRWAKVRSKYRLKSKSKVISLSERFRPNLRSKYILRPKLSWTLV